MSFGNSVGLPGMWSTKKKVTIHTITVNGVDHKIKIKNSEYRGNPNGFHYWIDNNPQKFFCNRLTRNEVLESAKKKIN